jgi:hypothetical protein
VYDTATLYDLVNGQADAFFAYGFEQVSVQTYEDGTGAMLRATVWKLATPADAYGLFTTNISGVPEQVGRGGDADPGRRIVFWQDRYFVDVFALPEQPAAVLRDLAGAVSANLPPGGERPALVERLPAGGLVARSPVFFHEELSIQGHPWLGGENLLGLSAETDGVLARYEVGGGLARLLMVEYGSAAAAQAGLAALDGAGLDGLAATDTRGELLGAVFGEVDASAALGLLQAALGGE